MIKVDNEKVIKLLIERGIYTPSEIEGPLFKGTFKIFCNDLHEDLQPSLDLWIKTGEISDYNVNGVTLDYIIKKEHSNFIDAMNSMSAFIKDPELAEQYKKTRYFYDKVGD